MDRMIYLSMSGAKAMLQRQDVLAHNLANVSTTGFRAELAAFRAVPVLGDGASTRVYALESTNGYSDAPGLVREHRPRARRGAERQGHAGGAVARRHRGLHPRRRPRPGCRGPADHAQRAAGAGRRRADHRAGQGAHRHRCRRHHQRHRRQRPAAGAGQAQAGDARRTDAARRRRAVPRRGRRTWPPIRPRGCSKARSKAAMSAPSKR